jgi:hypothetical protein
VLPLDIHKGEAIQQVIIIVHKLLRYKIELTCGCVNDGNSVFDCCCWPPLVDEAALSLKKRIDRTSFDLLLTFHIILLLYINKGDKTKIRFFFFFFVNKIIRGEICLSQDQNI